jgi:hypothetical protein
MSSISMLFVGGVVMLMWAELNKKKTLAFVIDPIGP